MKEDSFPVEEENFFHKKIAVKNNEHHQSICHLVVFE